MKQTFEEFGDALIDGINEENAMSQPTDNKMNMAEMFASFEQKMTDKLNGIESQVNAISIQPHTTDTDTDTDTDTENMHNNDNELNNESEDNNND